MKRTSIAWTDFSSNPIKYRDKVTGKVVWACVKAADECRNCYAETLGLRWGKGSPFTQPNLATVEPFLDDAEIRTLRRSRLIRGHRLFLGDMTDIFGAWVRTEWLDTIFAVFASRIDVIWQILTKRPARMRSYLNDPDMPWRVNRIVRSWADLHPDGPLLRQWPLVNVHGGTSAGSQPTADLFVPNLLRANLAVRWVSIEPLIASVDLTDIGDKRGTIPIQHDALTGEFQNGDREKTFTAHLNWATVGGESGAKHRPMELDWLALIVGQFKAAGVPIFVKQDSNQHPDRRGRIPDELWVRQFPPVDSAWLENYGAPTLAGGVSA